MNIFVVEENPEDSAVALCDKHVPKMTVESVQMLVSSLRRHGAGDADMPLTAKGTPHKGGYANHPSTRWAGESRENYMWLFNHAVSLASEFEYRFGKKHACEAQLNFLEGMEILIPDIGQTPVALCVGEELQSTYGATHLPMSEATKVYREFYNHDKREFAKWEKGRIAPSWWVA